MMENKLERFLGKDYSNNHIRNFLKYWIKVLPTMPDYYNDRQNYANWRKVNDLDCLYFDGDLRADIMMSAWTPINWVASYLNKESGIKFYKHAKNQDDSCYYLKLLVDEQDKYLPGDNELVVLLDRFAELAEQMCNFMLLPNRAMNSERYSISINDERVWVYDQVPSTLFHLFNKESLGKYFLDEDGEIDEKKIREWVLREHLEHGFVDEYITQSKVIPLIDGVNPVKGTWPQKEDEIKEALEYMIAFLKERQNKLEA